LLLVTVRQYTLPVNATVSM